MTTRRLAATPAFDMADFSAQIERDEEGTAARAHRIDSGGLIVRT